MYTHAVLSCINSQRIRSPLQKAKKCTPYFCSQYQGGLIYFMDVQARTAMMWLLQQQRQLPHPAAASLRSSTLEMIAMASTTQAPPPVLAAPAAAMASTTALEATTVSLL